MIDKLALGNFLRNAREESGMTQEKVGTAIERCSKAIGNIENGVSEPTLDTAAKMCDIYGISGNEIMQFYQRGDEMNQIMETLHIKK